MSRSNHERRNQRDRLSARGTFSTEDDDLRSAEELLEQTRSGGRQHDGTQPLRRDQSPSERTAAKTTPGTGGLDIRHGNPTPAE